MTKLIPYYQLKYKGSLTITNKAKHFTRASTHIILHTKYSVLQL